MSARTSLFLYGKETCHLCHDMSADVQLVAQNNGYTIDLIWQDIEDQPELEARYGLRIPVLTTPDDQLVCEGRLDAAALLKHLQTSKNHA